MLNDDCWLHIMSRCTTRDMSALLRTCQSVRSLREWAWRDAVHRDFANFEGKAIGISYRDKYEYIAEVSYTLRTIDESEYKPPKSVREGFLKISPCTIPGKNIRILPENIIIDASNINLDDNKISTIPASVKLVSRVISFDNNLITRIENSSSFNCYILNLSHNLLVGLNSGFPNVRDLINLSYNRIEQVPDWWNPSAESINLSHNLISAIPSSSLTQCDIIDLSYNNIISIPSDWYSTAYEINLQGNPIPKEYIKKLKQRMTLCKVLY